MDIQIKHTHPHGNFMDKVIIKKLGIHLLVADTKLHSEGHITLYPYTCIRYIGIIINYQLIAAATKQEQLLHKDGHSTSVRNSSGSSVCVEKFQCSDSFNLVSNMSRSVYFKVAYLWLQLVSPAAISR